VTAGSHGGGKVTPDAGLLYRRRNRILGGVGSNVLAALQGAADGAYRAEVEDVLPLEGLHDAHARLKSRTVHGKIIIDPGLDS